MGYRWQICLILLCCGLWVGAEAQGQGTAQPLPLGTPIEGQISNAAPSLRYTFEGQRGGFVSVTLTASTGNLDAVLTVLDAEGALMRVADDTNERNARIESLRLPRSGNYMLVVTRFGGELGTTAGTFTVQVDRIGVSSQSGSALRYEDTVINRVDERTPQHYYSFQAQRGDILNLQMQRISGDLDPLLQVVSADGAVIAESDDVPGSETLDAEVERLVVEQEGVYIIIATRYGEELGETSGSFVLTLAENDDSGLGNTLQTAAPLLPDETLESEITPARVEQFYTFTARENDLVRLTMDRVSGSLDAYLVVLDADLREIAADDDGGSGENARLSDLRIPANGQYYVKATRFDEADGTTIGVYRLTLEVLGGAFDQAAQDTLPLIYNSTVTGVIDDEQRAVTYAFYGSQGDVVSVSMNRGDGNLDPLVSILGEQLEPLVTDDDSGSAQNARIARYVLSRDGIYYVRATRYEGPEGPSDTSGSYILVLAQLPSP